MNKSHQWERVKKAINEPIIVSNLTDYHYQRIKNLFWPTKAKTTAEAWKSKMSLTRGNEENKKGVGYNLPVGMRITVKYKTVWELRQTSTDWPRVIREKVETVFCRWVPHAGHFTYRHPSPRITCWENNMRRLPRLISFVF